SEHGEEIVRPQIAGDAGDLALGGVAVLEPGGVLREELDGRRETHAAARRKLLLAELAAVEISPLARADAGELADLELLLHEARDVGAREVDQMGLAAIRAAAQLPHHGKALAALRRLLEVVADLEEALDEPWLAIEAILAQDRLGPRRRDCGPRQ